MSVAVSSRLGGLALPLATLAAFIGAWSLAASQYPPEQFPGPRQVIQALVELAEDGSLWTNCSISLLRFVSGYLLAVAVAMPLGLLLGRFVPVQRAVDPLIQILRPISPIAWFPLAVLWFGIGNAPAIYIIVLSAFFPVLLTTITAPAPGPPSGASSGPPPSPPAWSYCTSPSAPPGSIWWLVRCSVPSRGSGT